MPCLNIFRSDIGSDRLGTLPEPADALDTDELERVVNHIVNHRKRYVEGCHPMTHDNGIYPAPIYLDSFVLEFAKTVSIQHIYFILDFALEAPATARDVYYLWDIITT